MRGATAAVLFTLWSLGGTSGAEAPPTKARPAGPRTITVLEFAAYPPLFATESKTFDPLDLARESWKGWISKRGIPWGMTPELKPTLRLSFDCRALPWPSIKQHSVDGPDNNMRALDALALLHAMLGDEFKDDPAEAGIIAYLSSCTDPASGIPYSPDSISRGCAVGHGEHAKNLILMYQHTRQPEWREWAERALKTLRYYAIESEEPGVGPVATYRQGEFTPGQPPDLQSKDRRLGGWLHLALGWNLWAYAQWHEVTGDPQALAFATALGNRLCRGEDPEGNDGCFRPDGSFGGNSQQNSASWHMHGHTHCLPGLILLGRESIKAGQREVGLRFLGQASRSFDWLYDPLKNPDAGSMTGWLGEWLMVATGWDRQADCEGCTMGDVVQAACGLGAASRLDPSLKRFVNYYDWAEQIFTGQLVEQTFRLRRRYLEVVKENLSKRVSSEAIGEVVWHDQSANGVRVRLARGNVERVEGILPKGPQPVLRFDGQEYFGLTNSAALRLPEFSIFAVIKAVSSDQAQSIYCNYHNPINWGKGINLQLNADLRVCFFTTDGTEAHYDPMTSSRTLSEGYHLIAATYDGKQKNIWADGENVGSAPCKGLDYGGDSVAAIGALREFGFNFKSEIAELIICDSADAGRRATIESYLIGKYGIGTPAGHSAGGVKGAVLWLKADAGFVQDTSKSSPEFKAAEVERRYAEAVKTAERMVGQQLGACGFPDWVNKLPSDLDPKLPGIHMQGCCADATIRGAHAIWTEAITGNSNEARVNLAFNRKSPLVEVVSCLPHRGEVNIFVVGAKRVLVRVPEWAPKAEVKAFRARTPTPVSWEDSYVVFDVVRKGDQLTVTYPLRIAEVKETVGSLDGTRYTERWRGNTIVDISPPGKWIPLFQRPELELMTVPMKASP
jgi:hypothetical protein